MISALLPYFGLLLRGAMVTIGISLLALVLATLLGAIFGTLAARPGVVRHIVKIYVELIRSIPLLIIAFSVYYGLPLMLGWSPSAYVSATLALTVHGAAYMIEVVRMGVMSIGAGQWAAAQALGMSYSSTLVFVVAPQAIRVIVPAAIGILIDLIKGSSIMSVVTFTELLQTSINIRGVLHQISPLIAAALIYFLICFSLSILGKWLEHVGWRPERT